MQTEPSGRRTSTALSMVDGVRGRPDPQVPHYLDVLLLLQDRGARQRDERKNKGRNMVTRHAQGSGGFANTGFQQTIRQRTLHKEYAQV